MFRNAHASKDQNSPVDTPRKLAYETPCRYCKAPIYVAICSDGKWRSFEKRTVPAAPEHVWEWRKHQGMQETEKVPGHPLHFCAKYHGLGEALNELSGRRTA